MIDTCFSGGAKGADLEWEKAAKSAGHKVVHYGFRGMNQSKESFYSLNMVELLEADHYLVEANKTLKRGNFPYSSEYTNNLLRRNYWQIKNTERVYAVAPLDPKGTVRGGTGWAVQMAIDMRIPEIYLFDMPQRTWYRYGGRQNGLQMWESEWGWNPPKPHGHYTGIGSREITDAGIEAIRKVYE